MTERINPDEMFMSIAGLIARRGTCNRAQVGCIITVEERIRSTGYNGAPSGEPHCTEVGCDVRVLKVEKGDQVIKHCVRAVHAEANAIAWAAREGLSIQDGTMFTTMGICLNCAKLALNAGIYRLVYRDEYTEPEALDLLRRQDVHVEKCGTKPSSEAAVEADKKP